MTAMPNSLAVFDEIGYLRLNGHVERRGRFVCDEDRWVAGECHRDHDALSLAAGKLMRVCFEAIFSVGDANQLQLSTARSRDSFVSMPRCNLSASVICLDCQNRLSDVIGS